MVHNQSTTIFSNSKLHSLIEEHKALESCKFVFLSPLKTTSTYKQTNFY